MGLITSGKHLPPNMVVVAAVAEGIKADAVEAMAVVDAGVLGAVDAVEAADTKEEDVVVVGGATPLVASMILIYQTATILPMNYNKW